MAKESQNKPIESFSALGVSVRVFENVSENGVHYDRIQILRTYRDGDSFKSTSAFSIEDLPTVELFARKAYEYCIQRRDQQRKQSA